MPQRYVSEELTHFVGRALAAENQRYDTLVSILKGGVLKSKENHPDFGEGLGGVMWGPTAKISDDQMFTPMVICFCDIPLADVNIHMSKYSRFGLAFLKSYLVRKGANPVFYVAQDADTVVQPDVILPRGQYFDMMFEKIQKQWGPFELILRRHDQGTPLSEEDKLTLPLKMFLDREVFSFVKCFDSSKSEDDPENYYMEREWRVYSSLHFELKDVHRVIIPHVYAARFRDDFPDYCGEVTFAEERSG